MKSFTKRGLAVMAIILGAWSAAPHAHADGSSIHPGSICKAFDGNDAVYMRYFAFGLLNSKPYPSDVHVTCPLTRSGTNRTNGAYIVVYLLHNISQTTTCWASSESMVNGGLASQEASVTASGLVTIHFDLTGPGKSDTVSYYVVRCNLQGGGIATLSGISLAEL
jgi:hypothetical protein